MGICETCDGSAAFQGADRCTNCWEVERRLDDYLRSAGGRKFVAETLLRAPTVVGTALAEDTVLERVIVDLTHVQARLDHESEKAAHIGDARGALAAALGRHTP